MLRQENGSLLSPFAADIFTEILKGTLLPTFTLVMHTYWTALESTESEILTCIGPIGHRHPGAVRNNSCFHQVICMHVLNLQYGNVLKFRTLVPCQSKKKRAKIRNR